MGKRVLRPGGIELTRRVIAEADPTSEDRIVEFGPGVGRTAEILLAVEPRQYTGVDPKNSQGAPQLLEVLKAHPQARLQTADARQTGLPDACADLVVGEALLTMQSDQDKLAIMREAFRILAPGGRYAIHELGFRPDDVPEPLPDDDPEAGRWYVYHRAGRACLRCGRSVCEREVVGRRLFWCPGCVVRFLSGVMGVNLQGGGVICVLPPDGMGHEGWGTC